MIHQHWEPVIGLEIHVQLNTQSKLLSFAPAVSDSIPNQSANMVDLAFPGTLPTVNGEAVRKTLRFGCAIDAEIAGECRFDRKNYFYPDLPKGYQITQFFQPVVGKGSIEFMLTDRTLKTVRINRAHLEEDAGKSIHDSFDTATGIDLNRAGIPLMEIVTEPVLTSAMEAAECFRYLHNLVVWLDICSGRLNEGAMRCDANVSIRPKGEKTLLERTELKNINSFRFLQRAIDHEIERQITRVESGEPVKRESRQYDPVKDMTKPMRSKEETGDYRYLPDPDLLPIKISESLVTSIRADLPELPAARRQRFQREYGLSDSNTTQLTQSRAFSDYFEAVCVGCKDSNMVANWMLGELVARLHREELSFDQIKLSPKRFQRIMNYLEQNLLSSSGAKQVLDRAWDSDDEIDRIISELDLLQVSDLNQINQWVKDVIEQKPDQVQQLLAGKTKLLAYLVGQVMKISKGKADPKQVRDTFEIELDKQRT